MELQRSCVRVQDHRTALRENCAFREAGMNRSLLPASFATTPRTRVQRHNMRAIEAAQEYVQALVQQPVPTFDHKVLTGLWWKDRDLTDFDSYSQQLDLISLGGIQKKAAMFFIRGIRLEAKDAGMSFSISIVPITNCV